jgi:hypothetical protein
MQKRSHIKLKNLDTIVWCSWVAKIEIIYRLRIQVAKAFTQESNEKI